MFYILIIIQLAWMLFIIQERSCTIFTRTHSYYLHGFSARWIGNHGFSIGIDDVQPGELLNDQKSKRIDEGYENCDELIQQYYKGQLKLQPGCDAAQTLEAGVTGVLNKIRETTANVRIHFRLIYSIS